MYKDKKGFTLIELLIIIAIVVILLMAIMISLDRGRKNARINGAKISIRTVLPAIIACKDGGGTVNAPSASDICNTPVGFANAKWPILTNSYSYGIGSYNSATCNFKVNIGADVTSSGNSFIVCDCASQVCE